MQTGTQNKPLKATETYDICLGSICQKIFCNYVIFRENITGTRLE